MHESTQTGRSPSSHSSWSLSHSQKNLCVALYPSSSNPSLRFLPISPLYRFLCASLIFVTLGLRKDSVAFASG